MSAQDKQTGASLRAAVYAFAAWLSARPGVFSVGSNEHPSPLVEAAEKFLAERHAAELDPDQQTAAQVQALGHQIHPGMAQPSVRPE